MINYGFTKELEIPFDKAVEAIPPLCSPANAFRAIKAEENIGLLLPCNVIVHEKAVRLVR